MPYAKPVFRFAERKDAALILHFIRELARYEKLEHEVVATKELLEDLYVTPEYQGRGYGKALLQKLAEIAVQRGCGRLEWWCLDWNQPSIDFYLSLGAELMKDWTVYRIAGDSLSNLAEQSQIRKEE